MRVGATSDALGRSQAKWFVAGDLDGYFGLFFSGFPDLLLIVGLGPLCGFTSDFVTQRILPAVALSILAGNLFYAWQARQLAKRTGRSDVTAIPFGVNTADDFCLHLSDHDTGLQSNQRPGANLASRNALLFSKRHRADGRIVLYRLAPAYDAENRSALSTGWHCARLPLSWFRLPDLSKSRAGFTAGRDHPHVLLFAPAVTWKSAGRFALHCRRYFCRIDIEST
jgi:hypothetical protein